MAVTVIYRTSASKSTTHKLSGFDQAFVLQLTRADANGNGGSLSASLEDADMRVNAGGKVATASVDRAGVYLSISSLASVAETRACHSIASTSS